jgi:hypothetical protein
MTTKTMPFPPALDAWLTTHTDLAQLAATLFDDETFMDAYQGLYEQALAALTLPKNAAGMAALRTVIDTVPGGFAIADAGQDAGFICGFEFCRRLLTAKGEA